MPAGWTTKQIKDATGALITVRVWDETGTGGLGVTGPFSFGQVPCDGSGTTSAIVGIAHSGVTPDGSYPALVVSPSPNGIQFGAGAANAVTQRVTIDSGQVANLGPQLSSSSVPIVQALDGQGFLSTASVTTPTGTYTGPVLIGGKISFTPRTVGSATFLSGVIQDVTINLTTNITTGVELHLYLFNDDPSATTWTDNAQPTINTADRNKVIGVIRMNSAWSDVLATTVIKPQYSAFGPIPFNLPGANHLFGALLVGSGTGPYALGVGGLNISVGII